MAPLALLLLLLLQQQLARDAAALDVNVEHFGATACSGPLDACKPSSAAFDKAIRAVNASGGGAVHARGPGYYVTGGIELRSHVALVVHPQASINGSHDAKDWAPRTLVYPACTGESGEDDSGVLGGLFFASLASNFSITGGGAVNGGAAAWNSCGTGRPPVPGSIKHVQCGNKTRSNMFVFSQTTDVIVEDIQIQDSAGWTLNPQYSQRLSFRRLHITAPALGSEGHNTGEGKGRQPTNLKTIVLSRFSRLNSRPKNDLCYVVSSQTASIPGHVRTPNSSTPTTPPGTIALR